MSNNKIYWHFARVDEHGVPRLGYGDGREIRVGETLTVEGEPQLCEHGLHASERILDALVYAEGSVICKVTLGGIVIEDDDKAVATERTVIAMTTAEAGERILREFARHCALAVAHMWDMPDVVRQYLESGDESSRAAAWAAARAAAWDAARAAAWAAAWAAARDAAWAAAWAAARTAAWAAARDVVWAAAWDAARAAARDVAWAAAWAAQNDQLVEMVEAVLESNHVQKD